MEVMLQSSNGRIAHCIRELRTLNDALIEVGIGEYKEGMVKPKRKAKAKVVIKTSSVQASNKDFINNAIVVHFYLSQCASEV